MFQKRSLLSMFLLSIITLGFYHIYWLVKTKGELNTKGANLPTAWLLIIPFANIYFFWVYAEAFAKYVKRDDNGLVYFLLILFLPFISMFILQNYLNHAE